MFDKETSEGCRLVILVSLETPDVLPHHNGVPTLHKVYDWRMIPFTVVSRIRIPPMALSHKKRHLEREYLITPGIGDLLINVINHLQVLG